MTGTMLALYQINTHHQGVQWLGLKRLHHRHMRWSTTHPQASVAQDTPSGNQKSHMYTQQITIQQQQQQQQEQDQEQPWHFVPQTNERQLSWDDSAARRLIKVHVARKLARDVDYVEERIQQLGILLPDLVGKLERMKADLVLEYVSNLESFADKLIELKQLMPSTNLSRLAARSPHLLLQLSVQDIASQLDVLRLALPGADVEALIEEEPLLLKANVDKVLVEIERLMPGGDPARVLAGNPTLVMGMQELEMPTAEGESLL